MARGERLEELDDRSQALEQGARQFQKGAKKLKWSERCKSYRMCAIILVLLAVSKGYPAPAVRCTDVPSPLTARPQIIIVVILAAAGVFDKDK